MENIETKIKLGPATEWLMKEGFDLQVRYEPPRAGRACRYHVKLTNGNETINGNGYCYDVEQAAKDYLEGKFRSAKATLAYAETEINKYNFLCKKFGTKK